MAQVQLILREDVPNLGDAGDVVKVKPGFARNYLLPQGKAIVATEGQIQQLEHHKRVIADQLAKEMKDLKAVRDRLEQVELVVSMKAGEEGKLFGSVTTATLAELLAERGFEIDRRKITLEAPIKEVGEHVVPVRLRGELVAKVKLTVAADA